MIACLVVHWSWVRSLLRSSILVKYVIFIIFHWLKLLHKWNTSSQQGPRFAAFFQIGPLTISSLLFFILLINFRQFVLPIEIIQLILGESVLIKSVGIRVYTFKEIGGASQGFRTHCGDKLLDDIFYEICPVVAYTLSFVVILSPEIGKCSEYFGDVQRLRAIEFGPCQDMISVSNQITTREVRVCQITRNVVHHRKNRVVYGIGVGRKVLQK